MLRIALVNETKGMVKDYFGDIFEFVKETGKNGLPGDGTPDRPAIRPVNWVGCHDKSAIWKISIGGGGCFNAHHHCNMCEQSKHELVTFCESEYRCSACKLTNRARCRHWEVNDKEEVARKEVELSMLLHDWQEQTKARRQQDCDDSDSDDSPQIPQVDEPPIPFEDLIDNVMHIEENKQIQATSKLIVDPGHATRTLDPLHIDFLPLNQEQTRTFNSLLLEESELRGLTVDANESLSDRRLRLRRLLLQGLRIKRLRRCIDRDRNKIEMMEVEKLILCAMHAENRIAEKVLKCLLGKGFENRPSPKYDEYRAEIATHVNQEIFNHGDFSDGQWKFPMPDKKTGKTKKLIGDVKLTNAKGRKFVENVELLLPFIFIDTPESEVLKWEKAMRLLKESMAWIRKRDDFTDADIDSFQATADEFIELWIDLNGSEGMSNYLHDLAAGHFSYYLRKYRNLYRYSQQGTSASIICLTSTRYSFIRYY
jgi:hypothetical protein